MAKKTVALVDRGAGLFGEIQRLIVRGMGSPNYFNHDDFCRKNVDLAYQTLLGYGRPEVGYDWTNTNHIVLYGRNAIEALGVREVNNIVKALENGAKLTYIDVRASKTATKATKYLQIRPGTDYALNLALINVILKENLFDRDFVDRFVTGLPELENFIKPYTAEWLKRKPESLPMRLYLSQDSSAQTNLGLFFIQVGLLQDIWMPSILPAL